MANKVFGANEKIRIEVIGGRKIEGEFVHMNRTCIMVKNAIDRVNGKRYQHIATFYFAVIADYYAVSEDGREHFERKHANESMSSSSEVGNSTCSYNTKSSVEMTKKIFDDEHVERIQNSMKMAVYISQFDDKYHDAINDMKQQKIIAVNSDHNFGRLNPMRPLISITSGQRVYLFDMVRLGAMKKEFKAIFAANAPQKIIHRSTHFKDYLIHTEDSTLANVFDTLVRPSTNCAFRFLNHFLRLLLLTDGPFHIEANA